MTRPLVFFTLFYVLGILLGRYYFSVPLLAILVLPSILWILAERVLLKGKGQSSMLPFLLLFLGAGALLCSLAYTNVRGNIRDYCGEQGILTGMVADEPLWRENDVVFVLRPESWRPGLDEHRVTGDVRVTLRLEGEEYKLPYLVYGENVVVEGKLYAPGQKRNPGGFDYRSFLEHQGVSATLYSSVSSIRFLGLSENISSLHRASLEIKGRISHVLRAYLPAREGNLLVGMLFGERRALDENTEQMFRKSGVSHLLAVSGLHTGLVASFFWLFLRRIGIKGWLAFFLSVLVLCAYVYLTGMKPATLRAMIMVTLALGALNLGRERDLATALAAAALLTLLYRPLLLFTPGFQLSYGATASILMLATPLQKIFNRALSIAYSAVFSRNLTENNDTSGAGATAAPGAKELKEGEPEQKGMGTHLLGGDAPNYDFGSQPPLSLNFSSREYLPGSPSAAANALYDVPGGTGAKVSSEAGVFSHSDRASSFWGKLSALAAVSIAAQLGVLPLTAWYFYEVSLVALAANILLLPVMAIVLGAALAAALLGLLWPPLGSLLNLINYPLLSYMLFITNILGSLPFATCALFPPRLWEIALYYALLTLASIFLGVNASLQAKLLSFLRNRLRPAHLLIGLLLLGVFFAWNDISFGGGKELEVVFLDVGQGDAIYIRTPGADHMLLDGGGKPSYLGDIDEPGYRVLLPFLRERRIRSLDMVLVSHPHEDHYGGLLAVVEQVPVQLLLTSADEGGDETYRQFLDLAHEQSITREILKSGHRIILGPELEITVLHPPDELFQGTKSDANNNSLVLQLRYKEVYFLFTGDIEAPAVNLLIQEKKEELPAHILKVPHHGGRLENLPDLLKAVSPAVAVITVGNNPFGHPHATTLTALEEKGIKIYRSDENGAVFIYSDGYSFEVKTMF